MHETLSSGLAAAIQRHAVGYARKPSVVHLLLITSNLNLCQDAVNNHRHVFVSGLSGTGTRFDFSYMCGNAMEDDTNELDKLVKIVCPSAEELSVIINNVKCPECGILFRNAPRLRMHVLKTHQRKNLDKRVNVNFRYHCPENSCIYSPASERYFSTMKYLKQHYLKVHAAKTFACSSCDKSFSTEAARLAHLRVCGIQFTCSCLRVFSTYEALLTHGKRNAHIVDGKYKSTLIRKKSNRANTSFVIQLVHTMPQSNKKLVSILPQRPIIGAKVSLDVAVQTDDIKRYKRTQSPFVTGKRRESRETQTNGLSKERYQRKTVETQMNNGALQTTSEYRKIIQKHDLSKKAKHLFVKDLALNENFANEHLFPGSPLQLQHEVGLQDFWEEKNTSLGTQTSPEKDLLEALNDSVTQRELVSFYDREEEPNCMVLGTKNTTGASLVDVESSYRFTAASNSISRSDPMLTVEPFSGGFSSIETQTDTAYSQRTYPFDADDVALSRSFPLSSNTETQTSENLNNMEQLLYNNTCTQTCNDILPSDLGLSDIQTQTTWHELEDSTVSAETQTRDIPCQSNACSNISTCRSWLNIRTSHTETQTELLSIFEEFQ